MGKIGLAGLGRTQGGLGVMDVIKIPGRGRKGGGREGRTMSGADLAGRGTSGIFNNG